MRNPSSPLPSAPRHRASGNGRGAGSGARGLADLPLSAAPLRRFPAQRRSIARVQRMLDACAELLDESSYGELSTTRIAERAGVAIGSVYQFFPDKRALTQALCLRYLDLFTSRVAGRVAAIPQPCRTDVVDAVIDGYIDMHRTVPGFRTVRFGDPVGLDLLRADETAGPTTTRTRILTLRLRELLVAAVGARDDSVLDRSLTVAVEAADAVLELAFRHAPDGDPDLIAECKLLVHAYLARSLPESDGAEAERSGAFALRGE